jgi:hypothetical protein
MKEEGLDKEGKLIVPFDAITHRFSFWKKEWLEDNLNDENKKGLEDFKKEIKERIKMKLKIIDEQKKVLDLLNFFPS